MSKNLKTRNGFLHLYNPKKEGLGAYDAHYINAHKNRRCLKYDINDLRKERYAA